MVLWVIMLRGSWRCIKMMMRMRMRIMMMVPRGGRTRGT